jgi:hypothetical protein
MEMGVEGGGWIKTWGFKSKKINGVGENEKTVGMEKEA